MDNEDAKDTKDYPDCIPNTENTGTGRSIMSQEDKDRFMTDSDGQMTFTECREGNDRLDATVPVYISKSNALIKRIGKTTLLSEQALLVAIYKAKQRTRDSISGTALEKYYDRLQEMTGTDFAEGLIATFTSSELKSMMNIRTSRYAAAMDELMNMNVFTNSWHILYSDNGVIADTACVTGAVYDKKSGRVTIKFNDDISSKILNIKTSGGYTVLDSSIMSSVSKDLITWSVYQLLREEMSYREAVNKKKGFPPRKEYVSEFGFSEFKFLTTVNQVDLSSKSPDQIACAKLIKEKNYEEAEQVLPKESRMYDSWKHFRARVLVRSCAVINGWEGDGCYDEDEYDDYEALCAEHHPTDIHFRYVPIKSGQGSKVIGIRFYLRWDSDWTAQNDVTKLAAAEHAEEPAVSQEPRKMDAASEMDFIAEMSESIDIPMKVAEMRKVAMASGYDLERIKTAFTELKDLAATVTSDALIARMAVNSSAPALDSATFPGFSVRELEAMYHEAAKHMPEDYEGDEAAWAEEYTAYYRDKIQDDPEGTKTTVFKRLMDSLRKDYDGLAAKREVPTGCLKKNRAQDYMQRDYSGLDYFLLEVKKGVRVLDAGDMAIVESGNTEKIKEMYTRITGQA